MIRAIMDREEPRYGVNRAQGRMPAGRWHALQPC